MTTRIKTFNDSNGRDGFSAQSIDLVGGGVKGSEDFVATADQTDFTLATVFDEDNVIEGTVDGLRQAEGEAWERDVEDNKIIFSEGVPDGYDVHFTVYNKYT